jgi:hypothetical protein
MGKAPIKVVNARRERVWLLLLKGHNAKSITRELNVCDATIYNDIKFLTKKSKQYVYDMAKGLHALSYQKSIEGINLALSEAWNKFNDPAVPEKQRVAYLRLIKECNESIYTLTANGPCVLAMQDLTKRAEGLGINVDFNFRPNVVDINNNG